jgi:PhoH-like ATPase
MASKKDLFSLKPKSDEQVEALKYLHDPDIDLVVLIGSAGSGKTLMAVSAGLSQVIYERAYKKFVVSRPVVPMDGMEIGFIPGTIEEKMDPWTRPIYDAVEFFQRKDPRYLTKGVNPREFVDQGVMEVEPMTYIRGRTLPGEFWLLDEASNLSPHAIKTLITRAGEGTKIVITGDPDQIDNPNLTKENNGLVYVAERFKNHELARIVVLKDCFRSRLAQAAVELL